MNKTKRLILIISLVAFAVAATVCALIIIRNNRGDELSFTVNDTLEDGEGRSATVILLGGQSNASGCSRDDYLKQNLSENEYARYENGFDNVYITYYVSGFNESHGFVKSGVRQGESGGYFGPELGIADKLNELYPDETFFIIKCAWGGTNLYEQWLSPSGKGKTGDLYTHFVKYVNTYLEYLVSKNYDVKIAGMCWMQGESDSIDKARAEEYEEHLGDFIEDIRGEFEDYARDGGIVFVDACISENPLYWVHYDIINEAKQKVAASCEINYVISFVSPMP